MTRPAILDQDVVVVPREPTPEMAEAGYPWPPVWKRYAVMLDASPHADAWAEVRAYVEDLETENARLRSIVDWGESFCGMAHPDTTRAEVAEARISELEARLKEAERVIEPFADAARRVDAQYDAETGGQGPMLDDETATIMPLGDHWEVATVGHLRRARTFMEGSK